MPIVAMEDEDDVPRGRNGVSAIRKIREEEDDSLKAKIDALGADVDITVKLHRVEPREVRFKGERIQINGLCATYSELPTESQIEDSFGGGTYQLKVTRSNGQFVTSKTFRIAGRPKIDQYVDPEELRPEPATAPMMASSESDALASQALKTMKELIDQKKESGPDMTQIMAMMQAANAPLMAQIEAANAANAELRRDLAAKDARILEIITTKPDTSKEDNLLREVWNSDSRRLESIREAHQSEMRIMREHHEAALARLDDRHKDTIKSMERAHEREIDSMKEVHKQALESLKDSKDNRIDSLKSDISRLERELSEAKAETGALRAIKEKGLVEQATELAQVGDALKAIGIGGGGDDEDNRKWYEKAISAAVENPEAVAQIIGGVNAGPPQPQQQMQQQMQPQMQMPPVGQPFQGPDGQIYVRVDERNTMLLEHAQRMLAEQQQQVQAQQQMGQGQPGKAATRPPDPTEVAIAIKFIETAYSNGTPAEAFANTVKASIPQDILAYIEEQGMDNFLNNVAKLDKSSPLRNIAGRKYMREVGNFLLKGQAD